MKKKLYIAPKATIVKIETTAILAASVLQRARPSSTTLPSDDDWQADSDDKLWLE